MVLVALLCGLGARRFWQWGQTIPPNVVEPGTPRMAVNGPGGVGAVVAAAGSWWTS